MVFKIIVYFSSKFFLMKTLFQLLAIIFILASCKSSKDDGEQFKGFDANIFASDIKMLASDSFMGRKPFTKGEKLTVDYLKNRFKEIGLAPGNDDSYFQDVPMANIETKASPEMKVESKNGTFSLKGFDDYVIWTDKDVPSVSFNTDELVFAGFGVDAPERNWNDFAGLDVKGKVIMVMVNDPGFGVDTTLFRGDTMTYYGRWVYKFEEAARQGAKGCLVIHNTKAASYPFSVPQNHWNSSALRLDERGKDVKHCDIVGWISENAAVKLLETAGYDSTVFKKASVPGFKGFSLNEKLTTQISVKTTYNNSKNVIGKIVGSKRPNEYVIYTAHWDHLGIGKPNEAGDSIYNGALDNASGTAALLQLASVFKNQKEKPERTVIFLAVTAEEQGLWGSAYYAQNPIYPMDKTAGIINMDIVNVKGKTADITVVGKGQSDLEDYLKDAADKLDRKLVFEKHPESGFYYRSDHFNFAKVGVPGLYIGAGSEVIGKPKEYGAQKDEEYTSKKYHRPTDEYDNTWDLNGAIDDLKLLYLVGNRLANESKWPGWKDGSEFKRYRK